MMMPAPPGFSDAPLGGLGLNDPLRIWWWSVSGRLAELTRLPQGWDGSDSQLVSVANATTALRLIEKFLGSARSRIVLPDIVPGASGDVQVEWHSRNYDIEFHIISPDQTTVWLRSLT